MISETPGTSAEPVNVPVEGNGETHTDIHFEPSAVSEGDSEPALQESAETSVEGSSDSALEMPSGAEVVPPSAAILEGAEERSSSHEDMGQPVEELSGDPANAAGAPASGGGEAVAPEADPPALTPGLPLFSEPASTVLGVSALVLTASAVSPKLVALRGNPNGAMASYEGVAGTVLGSAWRRSSLFFTAAQAEQAAAITAINVAAALSQRAESVLLVELQLTSPSLWSMLGQPQVAHGIEDALCGRVSFEACLSQIDGRDLKVLMVKQAMSVEEADRLSGALNDFLEWAEERFAWLVVDCPPVLDAAWTKWFQLNADPVVLVASSAKTRKHELKVAARMLDSHLVSTILNCD